MEGSLEDTPYFICSNLSLKHLEYVALTRGITGCVCFVLCLATFIFELIYMCRLRRTNTLQRLFLYLTFSTLLYVGVLSFHIEHKFRYNGQDTVCQVVGFLDQYTGSVQLMFTVGITIAIFNSLFKTVCSPNKRLYGNHKIRRRVGFCIEIAFIITCFVIPACFAWIPFKLVPYGETGPWCWIKSLDNDCNREDEAYLEQLLLWYVPFILVSVFSFLCVIAILLFFIYIRCRLQVLPQKVKEKSKEMCLLFTFLLMLCIVCIVETATRSSVDIHKFEAMRMWFLYAIITPIGGIVIPISFFVYFLYNKCSFTPEPQEMGDHPCPAGSDEASASGGLFHAPDRVSAASNTDDRVQQFLTSSSVEKSDSWSNIVGVRQPLIDHRADRQSLGSVFYKSMEY